LAAGGHITIEGNVAKGFEAVRDAFLENFSRRKELGGACCVYRHGEKVVDLWDGIRNKSTGEPWEENTMALVHSTTKGLAAMTLAVFSRLARACRPQRGRRSRSAGCDHGPPNARVGARNAAGLSRISLGFYQSELLWRFDPGHRSLGQFFQEVIASSLGIDFYIRLPESIPNSRLAKLEQPSLIARLLGLPIRLQLEP